MSKAKTDALLKGYITKKHRSGIISREINEKDMSNPAALAIATMYQMHANYMDTFVEVARRAVSSINDKALEHALDDMEEMINLMDRAERDG